MPTNPIITPSKCGGFHIFDADSGTSSYGATEAEAIANLHADIEFHHNNPLDVEWVREKLAEGLASGICDKTPEEVLAEIISRRPARRAVGQAQREQTQPAPPPRLP